MAEPRQLPSGTWFVQFKTNGVRKSGTFPTKAAARAWQALAKADILNNKNGEIPNKTFGNLLEKYQEEVSPTKAGEKWEKVRIAMMLPV